MIIHECVPILSTMNYSYFEFGDESGIARHVANLTSVQLIGDEWCCDHNSVSVREEFHDSCWYNNILWSPRSNAYI